MTRLTSNQQRAVEARGNILVLAGAGTGKTYTLVECCVDRLLDPADPVSLDEILMVTFTEAAASEMRRRIQDRLETAVRENPGDLRLLEQLALVDTARICTLHSFCLQLVHDHFHELGLDPHVSVLSQERAMMVARQALETTLERHYAGQQPEDEQVRQLALNYGGYRDDAVRELVLQTHRYVQTLPDPQGWLAAQARLLEQDVPSHWQEWFFETVAVWRREWVERLIELAPDNPNAARCATALSNAPHNPDRGRIAAMLDAVLAADAEWPKQKKTVLREPLKPLFEESQFLRSIAAATDNDPLSEDWCLVREPLRALLRLTIEFSAEFSDAKRSLAAVDFHDLEQLALRLLWDARQNQPAQVAQQWRSKLRLVFVDEYQDINAAQDRILCALARDGEDANRFLVGDLKQSIYRFRLADPRICQKYAEQFRTDPAAGTVIPLNDNFRSQAPLLDFANCVFTALMRPELGGVAYDHDAQLKFRHISAQAPSLSAPADSPRVEFFLRLTGRNEETTDTAGPAAETGAAAAGGTEQEAFLVGRRLTELRNERFPVWDKDTGAFRPVEWRDMVVLLRAPRNRAEAFAMVFARLGIPLVTSRGGLYQTLEVSDILQLLKLLDNPVQDLPLLAVLHSPLVGMTLNELAIVRTEQRSGDFWTALRRFHSLCAPVAKISSTESQASNGETPQPEKSVAAPAASRGDDPAVAEIRSSAWARADRFLERFARWRRIARRGSLSRCLEAILQETHYEDRLQAQGGGQAVANVRRFLSLAREFDQSQGRGLYRFLQQVEAQMDTQSDPEPAVVGGENAVRLMSVHQSKGLEFPVVVVADAGRAFNLPELRKAIVLDEDLGLCARVRAPSSRRFYPSLPYWIAVRHQRREALGEELRLLYVAVTRASDKLILCGSTSKRATEKRWNPTSCAKPATRALLAAKSWLDWIAPLMPQLSRNPKWLESGSGRSTLVEWQVFDNGKLGCCKPIQEQNNQSDRGLDKAAASADAITTIPAQLQSLCRKFEQLGAWRYPHFAATNEPAKASVSVLRRRVVEESDAEAAPAFRFEIDDAGTLAVVHSHDLSAAARGTAHHRFLQFARLDSLITVGGVRAEVDRLRADGLLLQAEAEALDLESLSRFWASALGARILAESAKVVRELEFTARFSADDLRAVGVAVAAGLAPDDFIVVQGVVDLAVIRKSDLWILDFKTDNVTNTTLEAKVAAYRPQLILYARSLERIYRVPAAELWLHFLALGRSVQL